MYRTGSQIVGEVLGMLDEMANKWQKNTLAGSRKFQDWMEVFDDTVGAFVQGKAGQTLDRAGMEELIGTIKRAKVQYATKRR